MYASYGCVACHGELSDPGSALVWPWLGNIFEDGATRIDGVSAVQYIYDSILYPNDFIAPECPTRPCNGPVSNMIQNFAFAMSVNAQDLADLLAE